MGIEYRKAKYEEIASIYNDFIEKYFPPMEVKPLKRIYEMVEDSAYSIIVLCNNQEIVGTAFLSTSRDRTAYLLDYLCVDERYRSCGFGGMLLTEVALRYSDSLPLFIETETVESADNEKDRLNRCRRNEFYEQNGAKRVELVTNIFGVEYAIWVMNDYETNASAELRKIYHYMVDEKLYRKFVFIPK